MNKKLLTPLIVVVVLLLIGGGYFLFTRNASTPEEDEQGFIEESIPSLSPDEIGLEMVARSDGRAVKFIIGKADGIETVEYELSYEADVSAAAIAEGAEEGSKIGRAVTGEETIAGKSRYESKYLDLGSCSSGTCKYDTGVESVNLLLKITKDDGKVYQVEDSLAL